VGIRSFRIGKTELRNIRFLRFCLFCFEKNFMDLLLYNVMRNGI
jgi:hypothetical protein